MMLSRIADSLYWMGRYIERAENTCRLLKATHEFTVELSGLNDELAEQEWELLFGPPPMNEGLTLNARYIDSFMYDASNPFSVIYSIEQARSNARSIGEVLTREVIQQLNEMYHAMVSSRQAVALNPARLTDFTEATHKDILTLLGAIEHTLTRDQGWTYMKLGEAMERTQRTLRVIELKLPTLRAAHKARDLSMTFAFGRKMLLDLASLENYRRVYGARLEPDQVLRFLLFNDQTPRSVHSGLKRMKSYVDVLPSAHSGMPTMRRILGRRLAEAQYDEARIMAMNDLSEYTERAYRDLLSAHEAMVKPQHEVEA
jgi:uncharacterized alpha-E superfamily protein